MARKHGLDKEEVPEEPLEDQVKDQADEDVELENRKPDLGEIEEDTSEL